MEYDFLQLVKVERYDGFSGRLYDLIFDCVDYHTCEGVPETRLHSAGTTIQRSGQPHFFVVCERIVMVCLRVTPSCQSKSPSTFNIVSMVMDTLMCKMGCTSTLSVKVVIKKDQRCSSEIR